MKNLGLLVALVGILIVAGSVILTPSHQLNAVDSNNGLAAAAGIFFGGLIVFGAGVVIYAETLPENAKK